MQPDCPPISLDNLAPEIIDEAEKYSKWSSGVTKYYVVDRRQYYELRDRELGVKYDSMRDYRRLEALAHKLTIASDNARGAVWKMMNALHSKGKAAGAKYLWFVIEPDSDYVSVYEYDGRGYTTREFNAHIAELKNDLGRKGYVPNADESTELRRLWIRERTLTSRCYAVVRMFRAAIEARIKPWNNKRVHKLVEHPLYSERIIVSLSINGRSHRLTIQAYNIEWDSRYQVIEFTDKLSGWTTQINCTEYSWAIE